MRFSLMMTETGRVIDLRVTPARTVFASTLPACQLIEYAIKNIGAAAVLDERNGTRIFIRSKVIRAATISALLLWIRECDDKRLVLSDYKDSWRHRIYPSIDLVENELRAILHQREKKEHRRFVARRRNLNDVGAGTPFGYLYDAWSAGTRVSPGDVGAHCDRLFGGRFTILAEYNSSWRIKCMGNGYKTYQRAYIDAAAGTRLEDEPDIDYGRWVAEVHDETAREGRPRIDDIDAIIRVPRQGLKQRIGYRRIIAPLRDPTGVRLLVTASLLDSSIDLIGNSALNH